MEFVFRPAAAAPLFWGLLSSAFSAGVAAQSDAPTTLPTIPLASETAPATPPAVDAPTPEPVFETVIVTGELIRRPSERTVSSVAVKSGAEIERSTATDVYAVIAETPNASLDDSDYGVGGLTLRGIGSYGASGSGAYAAYSTSTAVVVDGVGLPRSALSYADLSAFDLASVEILRGPQSTSQGRNAMAGAVIINTVAPQIGSDFAPELRGRLGAGNEHSRPYAGAVQATLWPERLALRLVHDDRGEDGDIRNVSRAEHAARQRARNTRLRLNWQPGGVAGDYQALLSLADLHRRQGSRYVPMSDEERRIARSNAPQDDDNRAQLAALEQRLRFDERWALRSVSAYIRSETRSRFDTDYTAADLGATQQQENARAFSQELRLDYAGEVLRGSFGLYYYRDRNGDQSSGYIDINSSLRAAGLCGLLADCALPLGRIIYESQNPARVEDMAAFGEIDWDLTERLTLSAGLRVDREKNERVIGTRYTGDTVVSTTLVRLLATLGALPSDRDVRVSREFSEVLPRVALRYELFDGWYAGAAYAEGYRPGGDGYNQVSGRQFRFDAERTRNYELSFKGQHTPWRLQAALNLFQTQWDDMQIQLGEGSDNYMGNAGPARIRGGELELRWRALDNLHLIGGYGLTHGRFGNRVITADQLDLSGNRLPKAPAWSATLALEWRPLRDLMIRPDAQWSGAAAANADNQTQHALPSYWLLNLAMRWQIGRFGLFFNGSNLTDEHYRRDANNYGMQGLDVVSLGEGRRLSGGLEFTF